MENYNNIDERSYANFYYLDDKLHRIAGPAAEWADGEKEWYQNGLLHRIDGPAYEGANGYKEWWVEGKKMESQEEFERLIKLKLFW